MINFNINSSQHLSLLFFGGFIKTKKKEVMIDNNGEIIYYKTGINAKLPREHFVEGKIQIKGLGIKPLYKWRTKKEGIYSVNEEVLEYISSENYKNQALIRQDFKINAAFNIAKLVLKIREIKKQLSTYYKSTCDKIEQDSCVRGQFQLAASDTGRTSCISPPLQTQPKSSESLVRQHFSSRFKDGKIVIADFSQIEVVVQAELSQDENYRKDLIDNKIDIHCKWLSRKEKIPYSQVIELVKVNEDPVWIAKRSNIKALTFSRNYRAQPSTVAKKINLSEEEVLELFKHERLDYPKLEEFNENLRKKVEKYGGYRSITGKAYFFKKKPYFDKEYNRWNNYRYPEVVNFIVQGTATDISLIMLGKFWRKKVLNSVVKCDHKMCVNGTIECTSGSFFCNNCQGTGKIKKYLLWNFVHDEIDLDCREQYIEDLKKDLQILDNWPLESITLFKYSWKIPLKINMSVGNNWWECK